MIYRITIYCVTGILCILITHFLSLTPIWACWYGFMARGLIEPCLAKP